MLEYENESGYMIEVQRADAERRVAAVPKRKPFVKQFLYPIVALALGVVMLVTAIVIPKKQDGNFPPNEIPYQKTEFQVAALNALIRSVESSKMQDAPKQLTLGKLRDLLSALDRIEYVSELTSEVVAVIVAVDDAVESVNTYKKVATGLYGTKNANAIKTAKALLNLSGTAFSQDLTKMRNGLDGDNFKTNLTEYTAAVIVGIAATELEPTEQLTAAFNGFAESLTALVSEVNGGSRDEAWITENTDATFLNGGAAVGVVLSAQYENKAGRDLVKEQLMSIFGITDEMLPELKCDKMPTFAEDTTTSEGEQQGSSGGAGDGNELYGSNDVVFDPTQPGGGAYVNYGEAFDDYYSAIEGLLIDGDLSPEVKKFLSEYFRSLSDATKAEDDGTN
jgi:hypothetical protein